MIALRMCPTKVSACGSKNNFIFNKVGDSIKMNMTMSPGDICYISSRAKCGIPTLEFETNLDWASLEIFTIDYDDLDLDSDYYQV